MAIGQLSGNFNVRDSLQTSVAPARAVLAREVRTDAGALLMEQLDSLSDAVKNVSDPALRKQWGDDVANCRREVEDATASLAGVKQGESRAASRVSRAPTEQSYGTAEAKCAKACKALAALGVSIEGSEAMLEPSTSRAMLKAVGVALLVLTVMAVAVLAWPVISSAAAAAAGGGAVAAIAAAVGGGLAAGATCSAAIGGALMLGRSLKRDRAGDFTQLASRLPDMATEHFARLAKENGTLDALSSAMIDCDDHGTVCSWLGIAAGSDAETGEAMLRSALQSNTGAGRYRDLIDQAIDASKLTSEKRTELRSDALVADKSIEQREPGQEQHPELDSGHLGNARAQAIKPMQPPGPDTLSERSRDSSAPSVSSFCDSQVLYETEVNGQGEFEKLREVPSETSLRKRAESAVQKGTEILQEVSRGYEEVINNDALNKRDKFESLSQMMKYLERNFFLNDFENNLVSFSDAEALGESIAGQTDYSLDGLSELISLTTQKGFKLDLITDAQEREKLRADLRHITAATQELWKTINDKRSDLAPLSGFRHRIQFALDGVAAPQSRVPGVESMPTARDTSNGAPRPSRLSR